MSFYRLPHPWNPGYVIPRYVMAEPPERGTFTTAWLPRGTIPTLVPDYLAVPQRRGSSLAKPTLAESSLKGSSLAKSSLDGDSLGATRYELEPLGATTASFSRYGQQVARDLVARMRGLPPKLRGPVMKKTLGAIDKTLPARAEKYANQARRAGASAPQALEAGIARAVSEGVVGELARVGRAARRSPRPGAPRGLGRSPTSLGALPTKGQTLTAVSPVITAIATATGVVQPQPGQCMVRDGREYIFVKLPDGTGAWNQKKASQTCTSMYEGTVAGQTTVHEAGSAPPAPTREQAEFRAVEVGPFKFPADQQWSASTWWGKKLPGDWQAFVRRVAAGGSQTPWMNAAMSQFFNTSVAINSDYVGLSARTSKPSWNPVARTKHPDTGKDYGVFLALTFRYPDKPMNDPVANPPVLNVIWAPIQKSWYEKIWDWIEKIASKIVNVIKDALEAVKDATCSLLTQQGVEQAAVSAAATGPTPATAGVAAGVVVGQKLCGGEKPREMPPMPPVTSGGGYLVPLAIAGGGLLFVLALGRKRK